MKDIISIGYQKRFDDKGYLYNQSIRITYENFNKLRIAIQNERNLGFPNHNHYFNGDENSKIYLKNLKTLYLNSTQRRFMCWYFDINLMDRNTYIILNKK